MNLQTLHRSCGDKIRSFLSICMGMSESESPSSFVEGLDSPDGSGEVWQCFPLLSSRGCEFASGFMASSFEISSLCNIFFNSCYSSSHVIQLVLVMTLSVYHKSVHVIRLQ